jgi:D-cysteine desulfhydrase
MIKVLRKLNLINSPTPLHPAPNLSAEVGVEILFKRDDLTGMGLGGNKLRALEFLLADALEQGCDSLVTGAGPQSNWAMLAALAATRYGLTPHLVFYGQRPKTATGNYLLVRTLKVDVRFTGSAERESVDRGIEALQQHLKADGRRPYVLPRGGATGLGSVGYLHASKEIADQLDEPPRMLWLATGSCGTQAGLVAGKSWLDASYEVVGVSVSRPVTECVRRIRKLSSEAATEAGTTAPSGKINVRDGWIGPGYGVPSEEGRKAAELTARTEGIFLDPVFGAKAMAALIAEAPKGPVVFLVSGGAPTLFADAKAGL